MVDGDLHYQPESCLAWLILLKYPKSLIFAWQVEKPVQQGSGISPLMIRLAFNLNPFRTDKLTGYLCSSLINNNHISI